MNQSAALLDSLRSDGLRAFRAHGLPDRRIETWKYTPLRGLEADADTPLSTAPLLVDAPRAEGLVILPLAQAVASAATGVAELLAGLDVSQAPQALAALNNAALDQGLYIHVPEGVDGGQLEWSWPAIDTGWRHSRICLVMAPGSRLQVLERFQAGGPGALNVVMQVALADRARLDHARLQNGSPATALVTRTELSQSANSQYQYTGLDLDGPLVRHDLRSRLLGPGAQCAMRGAYLLDGAAHVDNHLEIIHDARDCASEQTFRGVLDGHARAVFNGRVHVCPGADGSEAIQSNANLLLSADAEVDTKPELEIEADEVVARHGATVGQLDETAVFYLRSRGLPELQSRKMLTGAFCRSVLEGMPDSRARTVLGSALDAALGEIS